MLIQVKTWKLSVISEAFLGEKEEEAPGNRFGFHFESREKFGMKALYLFKRQYWLTSQQEGSTVSLW